MNKPWPPRNWNFGRVKKRTIMQLVGLIVLAIAAAIQLFMPAPGVGDVKGYPRAIDGDSLVVNGREIRLKGIDAPEGRQFCRRDGRSWACGEESRDVLVAMIGSGEVFCKGIDIDKHDRLLAVCSANGLELNREMVARGFAVSYGAYKKEEISAKRSRLGLWSSEFDFPKEWRRQRNIGR